MRNLKLSFFTAIVFFCTAFQGQSPEPKRYSLSFEYGEWVKFSTGLQYTLERIRQSDLPSRDVSLITDSVLAPLISQIGTQIPRQMEAEKKAADTLNKKPAKKN